MVTTCFDSVFILGIGLALSFAQPEHPMKINIIPTNNLAMLSAAVCAVMLAFTNNARADTNLGFFDPVTLTGDSHVVGTVSPGAPASPADVADYINFMITMGTNTTVSHDFGG